MLSQFVEFMTSLTLHLSKVTPWNTELTWSASSPLFTSCEISTSDVVVHFLLSVPKIEETLTICSLLAFSYWKRAFERWPVRSRISFSSTPALKSDVAHVTLRQWAVYFLIPATEHMFGKIWFKVLIPTGTLSNPKRFFLSLKSSKMLCPFYKENHKNPNTVDKLQPNNEHEFDPLSWQICVTARGSWLTPKWHIPTKPFLSHCIAIVYKQ